MNKKTFTFTIYDIVEIAMLSALAIVLDQFVKIPIGATGGSINISTLPLFFISLRHGWFKGFISGAFIYGLTTCLIDGYGLHFYPLEYLVAFGSTGFLGIFSGYIYKNYESKKGIIISLFLLIASVLAFTVIRYFVASLDSIIFYEGYTWAAAFLYHSTYIPISAATVLVLLCVLIYPLMKINKLFPTSYLKEYKK